ncbi:MAG: hypothetical protein ACI9SK_002594, partial [Zhongshania sp.]
NIHRRIFTCCSDDGRGPKRSIMGTNTISAINRTAKIVIRFAMQGAPYKKVSRLIHKRYWVCMQGLMSTSPYTTY